MTRHIIKPVEVGRRKADSALFLYLTDFGIEIEIAYRLWILRSSEGLIVVDTSVSRHLVKCSTILKASVANMPLSIVHGRWVGQTST